MPAERILILGGTAEARDIAARLLKAGLDVTSSMAGVTQNPVLPPGRVRRGGFGGEEGLYAYLVEKRFAALVDATHPYAEVISRNGAKAAERFGIPCLRLERQGWEEGKDDRWTHVSSVDAAVTCLPSGARILLTIGRKQIAPFFARPDLSGLARMIEKPDVAVPPGWEVILGRPPFELHSERELLQVNKITHIVTKNAGGALTEAKLAAARKLKLPVVMIDRPKTPASQSYSNVSDLVTAVCLVLVRNA